jgi:hypothetical protein
MYFSAARLLMAALVQLTQSMPVHVRTSPTATQSLSTLQDWS